MPASVTNSSLGKALSLAALLMTPARALAISPVCPGTARTQWAHTPRRRAEIPFSGPAQ